MPLIPNIGSDGIERSLGHTSSRDNGFTSFHPISLIPRSDMFSDTGYPIFEARSSLGSVNSTIMITDHQRYIVRAVATSMAALSLTSALLAVYWFCMMRRNFRRDLVLLLIVGGSWKSLWFLIFSVATFVRGSIPTSSPFCQASGYLLLVGFESCDIAILLMSMHMCLQIFPPARGIFGHDGLYSIRKYVIAIWFILPHIIASLAFINPRGGYTAQGSFCFLPVRPFWYRLALFWIPRYLIWVYITYVAVRIYRHVGAEFKVFGQERDRSSSLGMPGESSVDRAKHRDETKRRASQANVTLTEKSTLDADVESCAPDDVSFRLAPPQESTKSLQDSSAGKDGAPDWSDIGFSNEGSANGTPASKSMPTSRRDSRMLAPGVLSEDFAPPSTFDSSRHRGSITSLGSKRSAGHASFAEDIGLPSIVEGLPAQSAHATSEPSDNTVKKTMELRRRAIQRQLRLLFIYPCVYMMLWVVPFVMHCMNYTTYYAHHPVFGLNVVQIICMGVMTFVDVIIFSWREKPWRHIPGSDGTFSGSLCWWRYAFGGVWARARRESRAPSFPDDAAAEKLEHSHNKEQEKARNPSQIGLLASLKRWSLSLTGRSSQTSGTAAPPPTATTTARPTQSHKRTYSGGSDRKHLEAERAHERLMMERADYEQNRRSLQERRASVISGQVRGAEGESGRGREKEWFDRAGDEELFRDEEGGRRATT